MQPTNIGPIKLRDLNNKVIEDCKGSEDAGILMNVGCGPTVTGTLD